MLHERHKNLTWDEMRELITYQPISGKTYWNYRDVKWFKATKGRTAQHACNNWNSKYANTEIKVKNSSGYSRVSLLEYDIYLHRMIWLYMTAKWPEGDIDHINGNPSDNRWENLRDVSHSQNGRNQRRRLSNTSGATGVCWVTRISKWKAEIRDGERNIYLGNFSSFEEAVAVRKAAEIKYGYDQNHGHD